MDRQVRQILQSMNADDQADILAAMDRIGKDIDSITADELDTLLEELE